MQTLKIEHGSLTLNIPYSVFVKGTSEFNDSSDGYFAMLRQRYPWLSENSITVLRRRTCEEMRRIIEDGMKGARKARMLSDEGKHLEAVKHLESYLVDHSEDGDAWYALGEILCRIGRDDEGYKAMSHGRRFFRS